jgi:hypothetical protein
MSILFRQTSEQIEKNTMPIIVRPIANGLMWLDSKFRAKGQPITNFTLDKQSRQFSMDNVYRVCVRKVNFPVNVPNVNVRNNFIVIADSAGNLYKGVMSPVGYYNVQNFQAGLQTTLNSMTPAFPATFAVTLSGLITGNAFILTTTPPTLFRIVPQEGINSVRQDLATLAGFTGPISSTLATVHQSDSQNNLVYTRYIDVVSHNLHQYNQLSDEDSKPQTCHIITRVFLNYLNPVYDQSQYTAGEPSGVYNGGLHTNSYYTSFEEANLKWLSFIPSRCLGTIDIQLKDEFGDELLVSPYGVADFCIECLTTSEK